MDDTVQLATKDELKAEISKLGKDLNNRMDGMDKRFDGIDKRFDGIDKKFDRMDERMDGLVTKYEFDAKFQELEDKMYTKADHAKFMILMDEAMTELRDAREGRRLNERQILRLDDYIANHERRITVLEK